MSSGATLRSGGRLPLPVILRFYLDPIEKKGKEHMTNSMSNFLSARSFWGLMVRDVRVLRRE